MVDAVLVKLLIAAAVLFGGGAGILFFPRKTTYDASTFVPKIDCVDEGFDMAAYLETEREGLEGSSSPDAAVHFWYERMFDKFGRGHQFLSVGSGWGESCLSNPNGAGCAPFQTIIRKFNTLQQCLEGIPADGDWMQKASVSGHFNDVKYTDVERVMTRLAMLANKAAGDDDDDGWAADMNLLGNVTSKPGELKQCASLLTRRQMKCYPALLGAPGFDGMTLQDHHRHGKFEQNRWVSYDCDVAPVCSRLAAQRLYHHQVMHFEPNYVKGAYRATAGLDPKHTWVRVGATGEMRNQGCEIQPRVYGGTVCWHYTKCSRLILSQLCSQYRACCPSEKVHSICKSDLRDRKCKVCVKK